MFVRFRLDRGLAMKSEEEEIVELDDSLTHKDITEELVEWSENYIDLSYEKLPSNTLLCEMCSGIVKKEDIECPHCGDDLLNMDMEEE